LGEEVDNSDDTLKKGRKHGSKAWGIIQQRMPRVAAEIVHLRRHMLFAQLPVAGGSFAEQPARFVMLLNGFLNSGLLRGRQGMM